MTTKTFRDLGVDDALVDALTDHDITSPFPIQELTIPLALDRADVIGQARTGTGKTLAFGLPVLQHTTHGGDGVQALIVTPTRELALQVATDLEEAGAKTGVRVLAVYGGTALDPQTDAFRADRVDIVVGTPGRLLDHVRRGNLRLSTVRTLVLDEADEMLDMGFLPDVEQLIDACGDERQTLLFSATMPSEVVALARRYLRHPTFIRAESEEPQIAPETEQHFFVVHRMDKPRVLARILQSPDAKLATVFVRTKRMADRLVEELRELKVNATPIHGDIRQASRERNLERFRKGKAEVLVATEVAARGLDIDDVTHVVNYDCPDDEKMYLHRIGRTGRAGAAGVAVTFATFQELDRLKMIRKAVGAAEHSVEEVFSTSDLLRDLFNLPERTPWDRFSSDDEGSTYRDDVAASATENETDDVTDAPSGRARERSKGRSETRTEDRSEAGRQDRSEAGTEDPSEDTIEDEEPTRVRTRSRERTSPGPSSNGTRSRSRDRGGKSDRSDGRDRTSSKGRSNGDAGSKERGSSTDRSGTGRSTQEKRSSKGGSGGSDRSGRGSKRRGGGKDRAPAPAAAAATAPADQRTTDGGSDARGNGAPTPSRRVKVEHLP